MAPFPFPAHQTGRADFPHPAFRLASWRGFRRGVGMVAPERDDFQFAVNGRTGEVSRAPVLHLVPPGEEGAHVIDDVVIDVPIRLGEAAVAEIRRPAEQKPVQLSAGFRPRGHVRGRQHFADLGLDPMHALLRGTCARG